MGWLVAWKGVTSCSMILWGLWGGASTKSIPPHQWKYASPSQEADDASGPFLLELIEMAQLRGVGRMEGHRLLSLPLSVAWQPEEGRSSEPQSLVLVSALQLGGQATMNNYVGPLTLDLQSGPGTSLTFMDHSLLVAVTRRQQSRSCPEPSVSHPRCQLRRELLKMDAGLHRLL